MELLALMIAVAAFVVAIGSQRRAERLAGDVREREDTIRWLLDRVGRLERGEPAQPAAPRAKKAGSPARRKPALKPALEPDAERAVPLPLERFRHPPEENAQPPAAPAPAPPPKPRPAAQPESVPPKQTTAPARSDVAAAAPASSPPRPAQRPTKQPPALRKAAAEKTPAVSLEALIGGRWFHFIGVMALLFGGAYLLKYGYDEDWFSPWLQVITGLLVGVGALVAGHVAARREFPILAAGAWGGGIALLHLVLFAGFRVHGVMPREAAFAGMVLTTIAGVGLAVWHRSLAAAVLAAVGAYLTPALLGGLWSEPGFLWTYLAILTAGFLVVCTLRDWPVLRALSFAAVVLHVCSWWLSVGPGEPVTTVLAVSAFLVLFVAEPVVGAVRQRLSEPAMATLIVGAVALLHATAVLLAFSGDDAAWRGATILATGVFLLGAAAVLVARRAQVVDLMRVLACAGATLVVLFPLAELELTRHEVTLTWAITSALFLLLERPGVASLARRWSLAALLLAGVRLMVFDVPGPLLDPVGWTPLFTTRGLVFAVVAAACACALWTRHRRGTDAEPVDAAARVVRDDFGTACERFCVTTLWMLAVSLPIVFLSLEVRSAFEAWVKPHFVGRLEAYQHARALWFALMWVAYAGLLLIVGRRRGSRLFQVLGAGFGAFVLGKLVFVELVLGYLPVADPLVNVRMAVLAGTVLVLWLVHREFAGTGAPGSQLAAVTLVLAHAFGLGAVCMEWHDALVGHDATGFLTGARWLGPPLLMTVHGVALLRLPLLGRRPAAATTGTAFLVLGSVAWLLLQPVLGISPTDHLLVSFRTLTGISAAVAVLAGAASLRRRSEPWLSEATPVMSVLGHVLVLAVIVLEVHDLFARHSDTWTAASSISVVTAVPAIVAGAWAMYGCGLHLAARRLGLLADSWTGLIVLSLAGCVAAVSIVAGHAAQHLLLNTRAIGCGAVILSLFAAAEIYRRGLRSSGDIAVFTSPRARELGTWIALATHMLVIALLTREALDYFATLPSDAAGAGWIDRDDARQLSLSLIWAVYGIGMVLAGFVRRFQPVRVMALVLLAITVLKVFLLDLSFLATPYRVLSFIVLGGVLVGVSYLYQRQARREPEPDLGGDTKGLE